MNTNQLTYLNGLEAALAAANRVCSQLHGEHEAACDGRVDQLARATAAYGGACKVWHAINELINVAHKAAS